MYIVNIKNFCYFEKAQKNLMSQTFPLRFLLFYLFLKKEKTVDHSFR